MAQVKTCVRDFLDVQFSKSWEFKVERRGTVFLNLLHDCVST